MDFGLSSDQVLLQDTLRRALAQCAPLDRVRRFAEDDAARADDVWATCVALGLPGLVIEEAYGGTALACVDAALIAEILGAAVAPVPFMTTCVIAPLALQAYAGEAQRERWLPRIARGELCIGLGLGKHTGARENAGVRFSDGRLEGRAPFVHDFAADTYLIADDDGALYLVAADAEGLAREPLVTIDRTRRSGSLTFDRVAAERIGDGPVAGAIERVLDTARVLVAADTLGAAQHMLDAAVGYAGEREQFGRKIASFQAVKHLCADMAAALEPCRALVWYAAYALDALPAEARVTACHTKALLAEVGTFVAKTATEVHGGVGFTDLLGLHYWFKRIGLNRQLCGGPERARHEAAIAQGLA